ncbi:CPBP family intramembrane glutamic endopeptidase [Halococcus hamelinensis]|uniref:CAAX prenyl protease 2/Lysostaphin resistance protein A-like domain-containing protein n=1 Tax=Halococcus hamelinensis 100A6 TaxID=1132509 RepID=M0M1C0_9EURY|nr:type II CAAX endopeptidase family protein [Halococcus hamelinensis]EMA38185.1 hypothetical protein C447_10670 [Halococcus hamelinensis 100A6]
MNSPVDTEADTSTDRSHLRTVAVAIGLLLAGMAVNNGVGLFAVLVFGVESVTTGGTGFLVGAVFGQGLVFVVALAYVRWRSLRIPFTLPSWKQSLLVGVGVVVSVVAASVLNLLRQSLSPPNTISGLGEVFAADPTLMLVVGVLSVVLFAPAEELLFRGAIQGRLREAFGSRWAVVGASTLFGAWHLLNFAGSLLGTILAAAVLGVVSLLWGYAYERTDNLAVPILIHGLYNLTFLLVSYAIL